jgi:hypothetical protein
MGTKLNRIEQEFILNTIIDQKIPLKLHTNRCDFEALIESYDDKKIIIEITSDSLPREGEDIRFFFFFQNNMHSFNAEINKIDDKKATIIKPEGIYKALQRKHERVRNPEDITASFVLKGKSIELDFPKMNNFVVVEKPQLSMQFDQSSISKLMLEFRKKFKPLVSDNKIVILKDRGPSGFEENLLYKSSKSLWIPSTQSDFPIEDPFPDGRIVTRDLLDEYVVEGEGDDIITSLSIKRIISEKYKNGIFSELYCPILYHQYLVGYIYLVNTKDKKEKIGFGLVEYVHQFAKVLCYSLEVNGYFKPTKISEKKYDTGIIDISASGLMFTHPAKELSRELLIHTDIDLNLRVKQRNMVVGSRVTRKFMDLNRLYIGLQFLDITPEDYRFLYETIYGKPFVEEYDNQWEGGIPPPTLNLE